MPLSTGTTVSVVGPNVITSVTASFDNSTADIVSGDDDDDDDDDENNGAFEGDLKITLPIGVLLLIGAGVLVFITCIFIPVFCICRRRRSGHYV